jgi:hypothetical protein
MIPKKNLWITLITAVVPIFLLISIAQAEEPYDLTMCSSGQVSMLLATKELVLYNFQGDGMTMSNHENKKFHGMSYRCIGTNRIENGVQQQVVYCKYMDADGDLVVGGGTRTGKEGTWKFLQGTGKWQGITGGGPIGAPVASGKPISEGTFQVCQRAKGTFSLP